MSNNFKLSHKFKLWFRQNQGAKNENWCMNLKPVASMSDIKQFWEIFQFLKKISELSNCELNIFKEGIQPKWQDANNAGGNHFRIKIDKKKSNKLWESTIFAMVSPKNTHIDVMNGVRIKIRDNCDQIQIWMNSLSAQKQKLEGLKNYLKENIQVTDERIYKLIPLRLV